MPTLVLSQRYSTDSDSMWRAALHRGWDVERIRGFQIDPALAARDPVLYGETLLADAAMDVLGLALLQPTADWLPRLPEARRLRPVRLAQLGEARALAGAAFVKAPDEKWFPARVYAPGELAATTPGLADDVPVLVAEPVTFEVEYRLFVLERAVATWSPYLRGGELARQGDAWPADPAEVDEALGFAAALLGDPAVEVPAAVVVDVGRIQGRGWAVVEANAAWASGLCGADPLEVLGVLRRASVPRDALSEEDLRWARRPEGFLDG